MPNSLHTILTSSFDICFSTCHYASCLLWTTVGMRNNANRVRGYRYLLHLLILIYHALHILLIGEIIDNNKTTVSKYLRISVFETIV